MKTINTFAIIRIYNQLTKVFFILTFLSGIFACIFLLLSLFVPALTLFFLTFILILPAVTFDDLKETEKRKLKNSGGHLL